jgi:hypothetical protein
MPFRATAALAVSLAILPSASLPAAPTLPVSAGGIAWTLPARWTAGAGSAMRVATYAVSAAKGTEAGECAVFFKLTGPAATVGAAQAEFDALVASIRKK